MDAGNMGSVCASAATFVGSSPAAIPVQTAKSAAQCHNVANKYGIHYIGGEVNELQRRRTKRTITVRDAQWRRRG